MTSPLAIAPEPGVAKPDPILVVARRAAHVRRAARGRRRPPRGAAQHDHRADRAERRGQDHAVQPADRVRPARRADRGASTAPSSRASPPTGSRARGMVRTFQLTKALARLTVLDNMLLARAEPARRAPRLRAAARIVADAGTREHRQGERSARALQPRRQEATTSRARSRVGSASCSRWRAR